MMASVAGGLRQYGKGNYNRNPHRPQSFEFSLTLISGAVIVIFSTGIFITTAMDQI